jgi:hypothetical protein
MSVAQILAARQRVTVADGERLIEAGWQRLDALRAEHGRETHAYMLAGWASAVRDEVGEPSPRLIALHVGAVPDADWREGVAIAISAAEADATAMALFLAKRERRGS